jgi:uncharacterized protein (DUF4213/DUF364 family)
LLILSFRYDVEISLPTSHRVLISEAKLLLGKSEGVRLLDIEESCGYGSIKNHIAETDELLGTLVSSAQRNPQALGTSASTNSRAHYAGTLLLKTA